MINFYVDLNHLDLMSVSGKDTEKFLQGQLTCDISGLDELEATRGAACDIKGRVISSFHAWKFAADRVYLEMAPGMMEIYGPILKKYMVFFKCEMDDAKDEFGRIGICGSDGREILSRLFPSLPERENVISSHGNNFLMLISATEPRYELWTGDSEGARFLEFLSDSLNQAPYEAWEMQDIQAGIFQVEPNSSGEYTPQVLNYDLAGHVSFTKGCYTGQEIVARMHYRGKPKKRLHGLRIESSQAVEAGNTLVSSAGKEEGEILKAVTLDDSAERVYHALTIMNLASREETLQLASDPNAQVELIPFEYSTEFKSA